MAQARGMKRLLNALGADEGLTRYVGGAVRDDLLGLPVSDIDLATRIPPDEVIERLREGEDQGGADRASTTARHRGQRRPPVRDHDLRRDVSTDGRRATVAFTDDWKEDAARRDFTINALSADPRPARCSTISAASTTSSAPHPLHRRPAAAHRRGPFADPALLPLPRPLRLGRARCARRSTPAPRAPTT
jgi:hypothetical protein